MGELILAMNFGATSSKIAIYDGTDKVFGTTIRYDSALLAEHKAPLTQFDFRRDSVYQAIKEIGRAHV